MWPSIHIIFEQEEPVHKVKETIENTKVDLEHGPKEAQKIIKQLNSKTKEELEDFNILDRKTIVMELKRIMTKYNSMIHLENKCKYLELQVRRFNKKFTLLQEKGLPTLRNYNSQLIPLENYQAQLCNIGDNASKFTKSKGISSGEAFIQGIQFDLNI